MIDGNIHKAMFWGMRRESVICLILVIATLMVYWQASNHVFINFDDDLYVTDNRYVQAGLTAESIRWAFSFEDKGYWQPLTWLSLMLDCQLFGVNPGLHHLVNLMLHLANTLLLFLVFRWMTGACWRSAFLAALFALHPINVESVVWVAERKNVLSTFFWLLTMLTYIRYSEQPNFFNYAIVFLVFTLGLMAKPMLVTLPFVLLLLDFWPLNRFGTKHLEGRSNERAGMFIFHLIRGSRIFRLILEKVPLLAISAISIHLSAAALDGDGIVISTELVPMKLRIANALVSYVKYIGKMIWPQKLAVYYPFPKMVPMWQTVGALMLLACISVFVIRALKKAPYLAVGWMWFLGTLAPVLGLMQAGLWPAMADRWAYVPLIGIFMMSVWGFSELAVRWHLRKAWTSLAAAAVLLIFTVTTWVQVGYWTDSVTLFEHTLDVTDNNDVAHNNLGLALVYKGKIDDAFPHFLEALKINPAHAKAHLNAGTCYMFQGKLDKAIEHFSNALRIEPDFALAHHNLGNTFARQGNTSEAIRHYLETIRLDPANARARYELSRLYQDKGESAKAKYE